MTLKSFLDTHHRCAQEVTGCSEGVNSCVSSNVIRIVGFFKSARIGILLHVLSKILFVVMWGGSDSNWSGSHDDGCYPILLTTNTQARWTVGDVS